MNAPFRDRRDGGRRLAAELAAYAGREDVLVLALPDGGVPVAWEVARALRVPLEIFVVRRLAVPGHEEYAMGTLASGGARTLDHAVLRASGITPELRARVTDAERAELARLERRYRGARPFPDLRGRTVIAVEDGLASGILMASAVGALRELAVSRIVAAAPIGSLSTSESLRRIADDCICVHTPEPLYGVSSWYEDFSPPSPAEIHALLRGGGPAFVPGLPSARAAGTFPHPP